MFTAVLERTWCSTVEHDGDVNFLVWKSHEQERAATPYTESHKVGLERPCIEDGVVSAFTITD